MPGNPTQTIFHGLALGVCVGGNSNFMFCVGGYTNLSVFRYQHVGIGNAKLWLWGSKPMPGPNANGFASQWNIGLRSDVIHERGHCYKHWAVYCSRYVIISKESDLDRT